MFETYSWKGANYRIASDRPDIIKASIRELRRELENYIKINPEFKTSLVPITPPRKGLSSPAAPPDIACRMMEAGRAAHVGPMAAVAGAVAQAAAETAMEAGARDVIVENGGDLYIGVVSRAAPLHIGLYTAQDSKLRNLAFRISPGSLPAAVCSSSGTMGHSFSFGSCDLVTVFSADASLADAAATAACNLVKTAGDIDSALNRTMEIKGVAGIVIVLGESVGMSGEVPELVRHSDPDLISKVTRNRFSNFPE